MKTVSKILRFGLLSLVFFTNCSEDVDNASVWKMEIPAIEGGFILDKKEISTNNELNDFGLTFFAKACGNPELFTNADGISDGNITVSPLSASMALAILANSGDKNVEKAILGMLGESDIETLNSTCNKLMRYLSNQSKDVEIKLANSVWYHNTLSPDEGWKNGLASNLFSLVSPLDFYDNQSVDIINRWCSANTNGMIQKFLENIDDQAKCIFLNALYFAAEWSSPFNTANTYKSDFNGKDHDENADMMYSQTELQYKESDGFRATKLSFTGYQNEMILILPDEGVDVNEVAKKIDNATLAERYVELPYVDDNGQSYEIKYRVELHLPKFNVSLTGDITKIIESCGLPESAKLDKMGLNETGNIKIRQKTATMIDEEGAKAAAVTGEVLIGAPTPSPTIIKDVTMNFNRPFIYIIRNNHTGSILMAGVINNL